MHGGRYIHPGIHATPATEAQKRSLPRSQRVVNGRAPARYLALSLYVCSGELLTTPHVCMHAVCTRPESKEGGRQRSLGLRALRTCQEQYCILGLQAPSAVHTRRVHGSDSAHTSCSENDSGGSFTRLNTRQTRSCRRRDAITTCHTSSGTSRLQAH